MQTLIILIVTTISQMIFGTQIYESSNEVFEPENNVLMSISEKDENIVEDTEIRVTTTPIYSIKPTTKPEPLITCRFSEESDCSYYQEQMFKEECTELRCCKKYDEDKYVVATDTVCQEYYVAEAERIVEKNRRAKEEYDRQMKEYLAQVKDYEQYLKEVEEYNNKIEEYAQLIEQQESIKQRPNSNMPMQYGTIGVDTPILR